MEKVQITAIICFTIIIVAFLYFALVIYYFKNKK